ncbi:hypothetical protein CY35_01G088400 [Sphagnum magellanicum]|nr:hypothetical protein CY35_01G088400 [Sphagnum magellanicum]
MTTTAGAAASLAVAFGSELRTEESKGSYSLSSSTSFARPLMDMPVVQQRLKIDARRGVVRINGLAQLFHLPKSGSANKRMQIALDSAGTGAEDDKDLLNKFLETRTGNRVSATEGRVRNWRKQNSGKTASNGNHVTALDAVTHRVPRSRSMPEESAFSSTHNIYDRSPVVALPQKMGVTETSSRSVSGMESSSFLTQKAELSEPVREILHIANNLPQNHSLEDCLVEFTNKISVVEGNLVLKVLGEEKLFVQALSFFQWMRLHKPCLLDSRSFSIIFNLLGKAKMINEALALYQSLPSDKTVRSVEVYNTLLTALSNCDRHEEIFAVLEQMQATGTEPDSVTFSILITEARKGKDGLHKVLGVYRCMMERGVRPDVTAFGSLIKAFCDTRHPKEALLAAIEMERLGMPLNVIIYNTLIDAYGKVGELEEMEGLVVEMKERGLEPNKKTFNILIHCYGCHGQYKVAEALMQEIEAAGLKPDVVTFTALIGAYGKQKMSDKAASVFNRMRNAGVTPNAYSYTALINAYSEGHWHEKAAMVFERMRQDGISPSVETYTALLDGYRRAGNIEMVKEVWKTMREENCAGTRVTFVTLVDAFAKQGLLRDARDVIFEFEKLGHKPDLMIYNMLLNAYCRGGNHRKGPEILHEIRSAGLKPDSFSYCTLIYAFLRVRDFTKAYKYHEEMLKKGKSPDPKTYAKLRAILKVSLQRKQVNDQKANAGQTPRQGSLRKIPENAKSFWKRAKRPSRRLLR